MLESMNNSMENESKSITESKLSETNKPFKVPEYLTRRSISTNTVFYPYFTKNRYLENEEIALLNILDSTGFVRELGKLTELIVLMNRITKVLIDSLNLTKKHLFLIKLILSTLGVYDSWSIVYFAPRS